jgi:glutathione S-transferase
VDHLRGGDPRRAVGWILNAQIFPEDRRRPEPVERGKKVWAIAAPFLEKSLGGKTWILGDRFTTADVVLGYDVGVAARLGGLEGFPELGAYMGRLGARPAFQKAYAG